MRTLNFQVPYALSRFENTGETYGNGAASASASDQDSGTNSLDNAKPNRYWTHLNWQVGILGE